MSARDKIAGRQLALKRIAEAKKQDRADSIAVLLRKAEAERTAEEREALAA